MADTSYRSALEIYLLSAPVKNLGLGALISPSELDLLERECQLSWDREADGLGGLLFTLRVNGVLVLTAPEVQHIGRNNL